MRFVYAFAVLFGVTGCFSMDATKAVIDNQYTINPFDRGILSVYRWDVENNSVSVVDHPFFLREGETEKESVYCCDVETRSDFRRKVSSVFGLTGDASWSKVAEGKIRGRIEDNTELEMVDPSTFNLKRTASGVVQQTFIRARKAQLNFEEHGVTDDFGDCLKNCTGADAFDDLKSAWGIIEAIEANKNNNNSVVYAIVNETYHARTSRIYFDDEIVLGAEAELDEDIAKVAEKILKVKTKNLVGKEVEVNVRMNNAEAILDQSEDRPIIIGYAFLRPGYTEEGNFSFTPIQNSKEINIRKFLETE